MEQSQTSHWLEVQIQFTIGMDYSSLGISCFTLWFASSNYRNENKNANNTLARKTEHMKATAGCMFI